MNRELTDADLDLISAGGAGTGILIGLGVITLAVRLWSLFRGRKRA